MELKRYRPPRPEAPLPDSRPVFLSFTPTPDGSGVAAGAAGAISRRGVTPGGGRGGPASGATSAAPGAMAGLAAVVAPVMPPTGALPPIGYDPDRPAPRGAVTAAPGADPRHGTARDSRYPISRSMALAATIARWTCGGFFHDGNGGAHSWVISQVRSCPAHTPVAFRSLFIPDESRFHPSSAAVTRQGVKRSSALLCDAPASRPV
jgi:hypothetical protein